MKPNSHLPSQESETVEFKASPGGTGTITIIEEMNKHGLPEPIFEEREGSFLVTLPKTSTES